MGGGKRFWMFLVGLGETTFRRGGCMVFEALVSRKGLVLKKWEVESGIDELERDMSQEWELL